MLRRGKINVKHLKSLKKMTVSLTYKKVYKKGMFKIGNEILLTTPAKCSNTSFSSFVLTL